MGNGIDWGRGKTNIDTETGIRYGVIHAHKVDWWNEHSESNYGDPTCGECGSDLVDLNADGCELDIEGFADSNGCDDYACESCRKIYDSSDSYGEDPVSFTLDADGYKAEQSGDDCDIFVLESPFYTLCAHCSPCAPGAGYITDSRKDGVKTYCFGHDMFEGGAPYPVFRVSDDTPVLPE